MFLRALEYYNGIVFLVSNYVGAIDVALSSRLSLVIYFGELDRYARAKVRESCQNKIRYDIHQRYEFSHEASIVLDSIVDSTDYSCNGREIRNSRCIKILCIEGFVGLILE